MLLGVAIFSYFLGDFIAIVQDIVTPPSENDEDSLSSFFGLIQYFNYNKEVEPKFKEQIENYFEYRWENDKN
jgi:hypothetical protein